MPPLADAAKKNSVNFRHDFSAITLSLHKHTFNYLSVYRIIQTLDDVVVAECAEQKRRDKIIWWDCLIQLWSILAHVFYTMKRMGLIAFMIFEVSILLGCGASMDKKAEKMELQAPNDLPNMVISLLDGSQIHGKKLGGKTVLILFFPDCDHCQREAAQIQKHIASFRGYTLYFLTTAPKQEAEKFAVDYKLNSIKNVKFGIITVNDVLSNFGAVATPSLYIYSSDHKLVQKFNGETQMDAILKYIK